MRNSCRQTTSGVALASHASNRGRRLRMLLMLKVAIFIVGSGVHVQWRMDATPVSIPVCDAPPVSGLLTLPRAARACFVFAHGAGAGMTHPFMAAFAADLAA